jgi:hypothetical protein
MKIVRESLTGKIIDLPKNKWSDVEEDNYANDLIKLVQIAYKKSTEGSFINTKKDVAESDWHSIDFDNKPDLDATIFYRGPRANETWKGYKIQGLGHDGSKQAIGVMLKRLKRLLTKDGVWLEASEAVEHILYKWGLPYIDDEEFAQEIFPDSDLKFLNDRGKYTRNVGNKEVQETIFGKPKLK